MKVFHLSVEIADRFFSATSLKEPWIIDWIRQIWLEKILAKTSWRLIRHLHSILQDSHWKLRQHKTTAIVNNKFIVTIVILLLAQHALLYYHHPKPV